MSVQGTPEEGRGRVASAGMTRIALATASDSLDLYEDGPLLIEALAAAGVDAEPASWGSAIDWSAFDAVVIRSTWDYPYRRAEFIQWVDRVAAVTRLANPAEVLRWNTDKRYLADLQSAGIDIVPTRWFDDGETEVTIPDEWDEVVVKPAVSVAGMLSARYGRADRAAAISHIADLVARGRGAMAQPYVRSIDRQPESGTYLFGGRVSHGITKSGILKPGGGVHDDHTLAVDQEVKPAEVSDLLAGFARRVVAAVPGSPTLLYARVDTVMNDDGDPWLIELEVTEPYFFLVHAPEAAARFAAAVVEWLA